MTRAPVTRRDLARRLVVDAATKPLNVAVPAVVVAAALLLGAVWLVAVAVVVYLGLVLDTALRDQKAARRVGAEAYADARARRTPELDAATLAPEIAQPVLAARAEAERIRNAIAEAELPYDDVSSEVSDLIADMDRIARRAQLVREYLAEQDVDDIRRRLERHRTRSGPNAEVVTALGEQLRVIDALREQLVRYGDELEHVVASLSVVRGQIIRAGAAEEAMVQQQLARDVRDLRGNVGTLADGMQEAFAQVESRG